MVGANRPGADRIAGAALNQGPVLPRESGAFEAFVGFEPSCARVPTDEPPHRPGVSAARRGRRECRIPDLADPTYATGVPMSLAGTVTRSVTKTQRNAAAPAVTDETSRPRRARRMVTGETDQAV